MTERYNKQDGGPATQMDSGEIAIDSDEERSATVGDRATEPNVGGQGLGQISGADGERPTSRDDADLVETAGETVAADTISGPIETNSVGTGTLARVDNANED
jgi:hypothetical protein